MPNGESKNWIRFCAAIDGFRSRYSKWPTTVRVPHFFPGELKEVLSESDHAKLLSKVKIIGDDSTFIAMDDLGNSYDYGQEGFSEKEPDIQALDWLDVNPGYFDQ